MDPKRPSNEPFEPRTWETMKKLRTRYASPLTLQTTYWKRFVKMRSPGKGPWPCVWMDDESVDIFRHHKITKSFFSLMWQFCTRLIFLMCNFCWKLTIHFNSCFFGSYIFHLSNIFTSEKQTKTTIKWRVSPGRWLGWPWHSALWLGRKLWFRKTASSKIFGRERPGRTLVERLARWWFQILYVLFSPLFGEDSHLD